MAHKIFKKWWVWIIIVIVVFIAWSSYSNYQAQKILECQGLAIAEKSTCQTNCFQEDLERSKNIEGTSEERIEKERLFNSCMGLCLLQYQANPCSIP